MLHLYTKCNVKWSRNDDRNLTDERRLRQRRRLGRRSPTYSFGVCIYTSGQRDEGKTSRM